MDPDSCGNNLQTNFQTSIHQERVHAPTACPGRKGAGKGMYFAKAWLRAVDARPPAPLPRVRLRAAPPRGGAMPRSRPCPAPGKGLGFGLAFAVLRLKFWWKIVSCVLQDRWKQEQDAAGFHRLCRRALAL